MLALHVMCSENGIVRRYVQRARAEARDRTSAAVDRAALRELRRRGYATMRVADIAHGAGVSLRTIYLRAPAKDVLVATALRRRAAALTRRVERWRPPAASADAILADLVALHERTYRAERQLLEALMDGGAPGGAEVLRSLDRVRLSLIERAVASIHSSGALRIAPREATALAHAMLAYPTWRAALTGPARRRAPRLIADALQASLLG